MEFEGHASRDANGVDPPRSSLSLPDGVDVRASDSRLPLIAGGHDENSPSHAIPAVERFKRDGFCVLEDVISKDTLDEVPFASMRPLCYPF
jgi:hypothetical protein